MTPHDQGTDRFRYDGYTVDPAAGLVSCTYSTGSHTFTERFTFDPVGDWSDPAADAAFRILFLLAGVSYYKTTAAPVIDLGDTATTAAERSFLSTYYARGLGEFAYRNGLNLEGIVVTGPEAGPTRRRPSPPTVPVGPTRPLIPFGGGIDSIVTVDALAQRDSDAALCIVHPPADRFAAIEDAAAVTGLPVIRIGREIDPLVRRSGELGFLNGHVPVTAIISAAAVAAAVLGGRDAVVLSNEWSASAPTLVERGRAVNHQWSKSEEFEQAFGQLVLDALGPSPAVFSYLRPRTELWVARRFAELTRFHGTFRSCNRAFDQDPAQRLDHWCGHCDKCCFIDLILAPYMDRATLAAIFGGTEPLTDPDNEERFATLLDLGPGAKPFECVGDVDECRAAVLLASARSDRRDDALLGRLRSEVERVTEAPSLEPSSLLTPRGGHHIPDRYAPSDLLVRAH